MSNNHSNNIIEVKNVSIGYSNKKDTFIVSENINFSINKGELISIVGTNGIGKSTLLKTLARIQPQKNGIILLNNKKFNEYSTLDIATQLSIVLTESPSSKNITVKELVSLGRHPYTNWIGILTEMDVCSFNSSTEGSLFFFCILTIFPFTGLGPLIFSNISHNSFLEY